VLLAAAPLLTGCGGSEHPGTAALVDGRRITVSQLQDRVQEVRDALRHQMTGGAQYEQVIGSTGTLNRDILQRLVLDEVVHKAAVDAGLGASRKELQGMRTDFEARAGGAKGLERMWLQQRGIAPERIDEDLRINLEVQKLSEKLGIEMNAPQGQAVFSKYLATAAQHMKIDVNPRYGAWDTKKNTRVDAKTPWLRDVTTPAQPAQPPQA
jgi:hypothetical protein